MERWSYRKREPTQVDFTCLSLLSFFLSFFLCPFLPSFTRRSFSSISWLKYVVFVKEEEEETKKINFQKNGSLLLKELIASSGGKDNPIRTFSSHQILQATNNFDWSYAICEDRFVCYKGTVENRAELIKNDKDEPFNFDPDNFYRDIAVSSMTSSHKNALKLLGCLEFPRPVLVCEYPEKGALTYMSAGEGIQPLAWSVRLKIAEEIADAVTYLHTEFPRTIIHRYLKLRNIFLDENWTAKLSSFSNTDSRGRVRCKRHGLCGQQDIGPQYNYIYLGPNESKAHSSSTQEDKKRRTCTFKTKRPHCQNEFDPLLSLCNDSPLTAVACR